MRTLEQQGIFARNYDGQRMDAERRIKEALKKISQLNKENKGVVNSPLLVALDLYVQNTSSQLNLKDAREILDLLLNELDRLRDSLQNTLNPIRQQETAAE